jgi:ADP-heptose:LPS heptosyltransferase
LPILDHSTEFHDFETTAALCECLDLVVAVDTSVAHLCGALGKATLLLLPFVPDWRWLMGRSDSPWYPSLTLLRQERRGDWDSVFASLREALSVFVSSKLTRPEGFTLGNTAHPDES